MEPILGEVRLFPFTFVPAGWLQCQGQTLQIASNQALFSLLGNNFGGDGATTFGIPDLRNDNPWSAIPGVVGVCIAVSGTYPNRE